jgi:hypothetical protein
MATPQSIRAKNLATLKRMRFRAASSLPVLRSAVKLRPLDEIARRLMALDALFTWVSQHQVPTAKVKAYAKTNKLVPWMTDKERAIWKTAREPARARHVAVIGWRLENMWPLAWILGFSPAPKPDGVMISQATIGAMFRFLPKTSETVADLLGRGKPRKESAVLAMEDFFYCAHNAARSAQLGEATVPRGFHPIAGGGVIHERRHALTWATTPAIAWDETDLST